MGVNPTPSNYKTFTFDNTNSAQYGVYITGQGVFNAPERNVEMVTIPGRNGSYALDHGNFNNIEVTYPAGIVADTEADFATAVSDLRNFLCSKEGYCRLEDDYNSGEYRMAVYKSGLEVTHEGLLTGEFNIVFECKPQRWLTSGETKTTLTSGGKVTNPTLFEAKPLFHVFGYGDIAIGEKTIIVKNTEVGELLLANASEIDSNTKVFTTLDEGNLANMNSGDTITVASGSELFIGTRDAQGRQAVSQVTANASSDITITDINSTIGTIVNRNHRITLGSFTYTNGGTDITSLDVKLDIVISDASYSGTISIPIVYDRSTRQISVGTITASPSLPSGYRIHLISGWSESYGTIRSNLKRVTGYSTKSISNMYIDLDIGEAYTITDGVISSTNNLVYIPADMPTLPSGDTTITFDNTFTKVDIVPRWWKV